jgi:hypothetical protein
VNEATRVIIWVSIFSIVLKAADQYLLRRFPVADQPKSIVLAAKIELCTGGFICLMSLLFLSLGVISFFFNIVCVVLFSTGIVWIILSWLLRRGNRHVRLYLLALFFLRLFIPFFGWIASPVSFYLLWISPEAKNYFNNNSNQALEPTSLNAGR